MRKSLFQFFKANTSLNASRINLSSRFNYAFATSEGEESHDDFKTKKKLEDVPDNELHEKIDQVLLFI